MKSSESIKNIALALAAFQGEVKDPSKDGKANYGKYVQLNGLLETIRPALSKHGLSLEADTDAIEKEIKRLAELKERNKKAVENIKNYLFYNMQAIGKAEIKTPLFTAKIQKNPPSVVITDENAIDAKYLTIIPQTFKVDKNRLKEDLKAGKELPYARLEQGERLVLK